MPEKTANLERIQMRREKNSEKFTQIKWNAICEQATDKKRARMRERATMRWKTTESEKCTLYWWHTLLNCLIYFNASPYGTRVHDHKFKHSKRCLLKDYFKKLEQTVTLRCVSVCTQFVILDALARSLATVQYRFFAFAVSLPLFRLLLFFSGQ